MVKRRKKVIVTKDISIEVVSPISYPYDRFPDMTLRDNQFFEE